MGEYNPHVQQILGEEWVPIREENFTLSPSVNAVEVGHGFTLATSRTLQSLRYYENSPSPNSNNQVFLASIYARGTEALSGPIQSVLIPVNNGGVTGTGISVSTGAQVANALLAPDDGNSIGFSDVGPLQQEVALFFATNSYNTALNGKRILAVNFRYSFIIDPRAIADQSNLNSAVFIGTDNNKFAVNYGNMSDDMGTYDPGSGNINYVIGTKRFGEINQMWDTTSLLVPNTSGERLPWNYTGLQRFEASASQRLHVHILVQLNNPDAVPDPAPFAILTYAALEVFYCEDQRLVIGSFQRPNTVGLSLVAPGVFPMTARQNNGTYTVNPTLSAGDYTITLSSPETGSLYTPAQSFPKLNALREYYSIPSHPGVQVNIPAPVDPTKVGAVFTKEQTHILPQMTVHTSGGPLTEVHSYGRQSVAQVWGSNTVTQEILDSAAGGAKSWPQVRYYARRFGNTTVPLKLDSPTITGTGLSVQITPAEFDALDEIIDGWKEITLRFTTAPTMGAGTNPQWRWSAASELAGNRWEVLGCTAPALSGVPGNLFNLAPSPHQLSNATYGAPNSGATINEGWLPQYAPPVTAASDDQTSDAVLMFAQDMFPVTGFSVTMLSQAVSGIGPDCGVDPCCIPSEIFYNRLAWSPVTGTLVALDMFNRSVTGWGTNDTGQTYTDSGGTVPGNYIVNGDMGTHVLDGAANTSRFSTLAGSYSDSHQQVTASLNVTPAGASIRASLIGHFVDTSNFDVVDFRWAVNGNLEIVIANVAAGVQTGLTNFNAGPFQAGQEWNLVADFSGATIRAKAWFTGAEEPDHYQVSAAASLTSGGIGIRSIRSTGNTNTDAVLSYDDYIVGPSTWNFGFYEIQRMDPLTDWATIMKATDPRTVAFNDYEARVGELSSYRIRAVDLYNFAGPWSSTVTETINEPGVEIGCEGGHLLIFTTNSDQDGAANLAYSSVWEGSGAANEDFDFPEAGDVILQKMYNKDFVTAFRPLERGGERFTRTVLVQAAAISAPTLGDFTALRDMAWDQFPYICVRDEDGNRWYATVLVPSGRVQLNRTIYMAPVTVMEVTDTPFPVDP